MYRLTLLVVAALVFSANGAVLVDERIINGSPIHISQAPYMASVTANKGSGAFSHICGGTIVGRYHVLTSAQCSLSTTAANLRVRTGSSTNHVGGDVIQVFHYVVHPQFNITTLINDISILYLNLLIPLGMNAQIVTLPPQGAYILDDTPCIATGWGSTVLGGPPQNQLHSVTLPIVNHAVCEEAFSGNFTITTNMICAGGIEAGLCTGDAGGPLVYNRVLYGMVFYGKGCGDPNYPSVYTKISQYRNWLNQHL